MFNSVSAITSSTLYSGSLKKTSKSGKWVKDLRMRTAYKSASTNEGLGEIEALMYRKDGVDYMPGFKALKRPNGAPMFEKDFFRKKIKSRVETTTGQSTPRSCMCQYRTWILDFLSN